MPRGRSTRWVVSIEDESGNRSVFGAWYDYDTARKHQEELLDLSGRYGGDGPEWEVELDALKPWPGIRALRNS